MPPNNPQYGTSQQQIAQMAGMIEASRRKSGGGSRPSPGVSDMSEMLRGELEAQRKSRVGTAIQKATIMPGMALTAASRMPNLDEMIAKAVGKISKVRGTGAGGAGQTEALTDAITKMGGLGYLGTSGIMNVPRQKQLAYEQQYRKQLGKTGTASSALSTLSMANRSLAVPRVLSMMYGGGMPTSLQGSMGMYDVGRPMAKTAASMAGVNLPGAMTSGFGGMATGMAPMIAAQMGLGMMKARKMAKITAQRSSGGAEEAKFSFSSSLDAQISMLASRGQLQPGDQIQIQIMKWIEAHTSVLPEMWADQKYLREEKEKGVTGMGTAYSKATTGMTDDGVISKAVGSAEGFMSRTVAKYDIFGQLFNFLSTGKLPKDFQEELEAAYASGSDRKDWKKTAKERGLGIAQSRLLDLTSQQIIDMAPSYEVKMLNILGASFDIQRLSASELLSIRKGGFGIPDTAVKTDDYERSAIGKVWDVLKSPVDMLTNIPGVNALFNMLKLPFSIGGKVRGAAKGVWGAARNFMLGGEETQELLSDEEALRKKAGIYKSPQEMANEFMGRGLPDIMEEMRSVGWRQIQELTNIYGVLHVLTQQMTGITHKRDERTFGKQVKKGVWSYTAGKYLDERGLQDQHQQDRERMELALEGAFKGTGMDRLGWLINKLGGGTGETVQERMASAAGMVRGVEAMPYDMAEGGARRGGLTGMMQMALAAPLIEIGQEMTLTPEEVMETAMYRQRGVKGRGRARAVPGWFGAEQARRQMSFEQDIWPQMQRKMMGGVGGIAAGAGAVGLGGAASLATGGALLPLLLMGGLGGATGAIPQNILEFMQTQKTFEGLSGQDIIKMTAGFADMPDVLQGEDKKYVQQYLQKTLTSKAYSTLGVDSDEFFTNINNLGFIQMALQTKGGSSAGLSIGVGTDNVFKGDADIQKGVGSIPGGLYGLISSIQRGESVPLPIQIADVSEEMILKFPGLFQVSEEWKVIKAEAKRRDDELERRETEKDRLRAEAERMKGMSAADRQRFIEKGSMSVAESRQQMIEEEWGEVESPTVKRMRPGSRASQSLIEREWSKHLKEEQDIEPEGSERRGVIGKIVDFMEYKKSRPKTPRGPSRFAQWLEKAANENQMAAAEGGVVGQTGLAYVHEGEIIGAPNVLMKILTGSSEDALGSAKAFGRGMKGELSELKQKMKETRMFGIFEDIRDKLGEIDENTEDIDQKGIGKKSKKKKEKGSFDISSIMSFLPMVVPAVLALLGAAAGGIPGGPTGAVVGGAAGVAAGLYGSKKALSATKTGVKKVTKKAAKSGLPLLKKVAPKLIKGGVKNLPLISALFAAYDAGQGFSGAQEEYGDVMDRDLSFMEKLAFGASDALKGATSFLDIPGMLGVHIPGVHSVDMAKMFGVTQARDAVKKSKDQGKQAKISMTKRLLALSSPDAKKLYEYDEDGNIVNWNALRWKQIVASSSDRYGWVTKEEGDAEGEVKAEIKKTTGITVKKFNRISNNLHKDAIRKYEMAQNENNTEYMKHYAEMMSAWSDLPPDVQVKMLQQQEGRLKTKAGDVPKAPPKTTAQAMSIDNESRRLDAKKREEHKKLVNISVSNEEKKLQEKRRISAEAEKRQKAKIAGGYSMSGASMGVDTASAGKVIKPGTGGMAGMSGGAEAIAGDYDGIYRGDDKRIYDTSESAGIDQVTESKSWWGKLKSALGFSEKKRFKYKPYKVGKGMGKGGVMWPGTTTVTSPFGPRRTKLRQASKMHKGVDMRADDVVAAFKGKVTGSGPNWGSIVISHGDLDPRKGFTTHYLHLANKQVKIGDDVNPGDVIGQAGNVGPIAGMKKHLHFAIKHKKQWYDPELVFKSLDPSFNPEYASDIVPGRQLGAKLGGKEIDLSKLGIEGEEAAGPFGMRYDAAGIRSSLADRIKDVQAEKQEREAKELPPRGNRLPPMGIPVPVDVGQTGRVMDEKDLEVTDPTLDRFIQSLFVDCAFEFNNRYKNYVYQSNMGHSFS